MIIYFGSIDITPPNDYDMWRTSDYTIPSHLTKEYNNDRHEINESKTIFRVISLFCCNPAQGFETRVGCKANYTFTNSKEPQRKINKNNAFLNDLNDWWCHMGQGK
jgi:hypothetical protein